MPPAPPLAHACGCSGAQRPGLDSRINAGWRLILYDLEELDEPVSGLVRVLLRHIDVLRTQATCTPGSCPRLPCSRCNPHWGLQVILREPCALIECRRDVPLESRAVRTGCGQLMRQHLRGIRALRT
eukprot:353872-Chlamydomonas_euryale.AAC.6